jgi:hypothetical protein
MRTWSLGLAILTLPLALGAGDPLLAVIILGFVALGVAIS